MSYISSNSFQTSSVTLNSPIRKSENKKLDKLLLSVRETVEKNKRKPDAVIKALVFPLLLQIRSILGADKLKYDAYSRQLNIVLKSPSSLSHRRALNIVLAELDSAMIDLELMPGTVNKKTWGPKLVSEVRKQLSLAPEKFASQLEKYLLKNGFPIGNAGMESYIIKLVVAQLCHVKVSSKHAGNVVCSTLPRLQENFNDKLIAAARKELALIKSNKGGTRSESWEGINFHDVDAARNTNDPQESSPPVISNLSLSSSPVHQYLPATENFSVGTPRPTALLQTGPQSVPVQVVVIEKSTTELTEPSPERHPRTPKAKRPKKRLKSKFVQFSKDGLEISGTGYGAYLPRSYSPLNGLFRAIHKHLQIEGKVEEYPLRSFTIKVDQKLGKEIGKILRFKGYLPTGSTVESVLARLNREIQEVVRAGFKIDEMAFMTFMQASLKLGSSSSKAHSVKSRSSSVRGSSNTVGFSKDGLEISGTGYGAYLPRSYSPLNGLFQAIHKHLHTQGKVEKYPLRPFTIKVDQKLGKEIGKILRLKGYLSEGSTVESVLARLNREIQELVQAGFKIDEMAVMTFFQKCLNLGSASSPSKPRSRRPRAQASHRRPSTRSNRSHHSYWGYN